MTPTQAPAAVLVAGPSRTRRPRAWPALALAVASAAAYAVFFALPYLVNDLARYPLAEVAYGQPDPATQWPHAGGGPVSLVFGIGAMFTLTLAPFAAAIAALWAVHDLWRERHARQARRIGASLLAICVAASVFVWLGSPLGSALITRFLD